MRFQGVKCEKVFSEIQIGEAAALPFVASFSASSTLTTRGENCTKDGEVWRLGPELTCFPAVPLLSNTPVPAVPRARGSPLPLLLLVSLTSGAGALAAPQGRRRLGSVCADRLACGHHRHLGLQQCLQLANFTLCMEK